MRNIAAVAFTTRPAAARARSGRRAVGWGSGLLALVALIVWGFHPLLGGLVTFLIVEDPLEPAAAIIILAGQVPFRAMEAAALYRDGWAPRLILARNEPTAERQALRALGMAAPDEWELSREVLIRMGVPSSAISTPADVVRGGTLEELQIIARAVEGAPVILVTSKVHTRRTRLTWRHVTGGRSPGIVRAARQDPFNPSWWWRERRCILEVVREYLGLLNYTAGFPVAARRPDE